MYVQYLRKVKDFGSPFIPGILGNGGFKPKSIRALQEDEKLVHVFVSVDLIYDLDKQCHASIKTGCLFVIENLPEFTSSTSNLVELPDQFIVTLNSISLSTTRGIMFSQFKGTYMHSAILPIVNPVSFNTTKN